MHILHGHVFEPGIERQDSICQHPRRKIIWTPLEYFLPCEATRKQQSTSVIGQASPLLAKWRDPGGSSTSGTDEGNLTGVSDRCVVISCCNFV
ncbi:hypothetical protein NDU88_005335 [Pleurodeles waltl]|uniref:Uncharacterized protein n=1 Tax=Pleurodeles waltl TaxID=8319 RepID=A0AAV7TV28_PLEWA|nr:hypothetical protein NDU88_005335 [Pleurodeles waltl]